MSDVSLPMVAIWLGATGFVAVGTMNLAGIRAAYQMYERSDIPTITYKIIGGIDLFAAVFLAEPDARLWGIALPAPSLLSRSSSLFIIAITQRPGAGPLFLLRWSRQCLRSRETTLARTKQISQ
jgi:hypothetical protein